MSVSRESTHSIVLALELEHQLANEDHELSPIKEAMSTATITGAADLPPLTDGEQYDPEILSSIVVQLRATLARVTQERDESNEALVEAGNKNATLEARAADLTELLEAETERSAKLEAERDQAIKTAQEAEEQINMLRAKVEESRRGVMRLQAESRRTSTLMQGAKPTGPLPLDLQSPAGARSPGFSSGFPTSKRSSFQLTPGSHLALGPRPLMNGGGHRRISSMSDPGSMEASQLPPDTPLGLPTVVGIDGLPPSPVTHSFSPNRPSRITGRRDISPPSPIAEALTAEVESLRGELTQTKAQLESVKRDLAESNDAREAADACAKALRSFISEQAVGEDSPPPSQPARPMSVSSSNSWGADSPSANNRGLKGIRLPPLPTDQDIPEDVGTISQSKAKAGWGIKLWSQKAGEAPSTGELPIPKNPSTDPTSSPASTPLTSFVSSWTRNVAIPPVTTPVTQPDPLAPSPPVAPPAGIRKFSFFSRGATASSSSAVVTPPPAIPESEPMTSSAVSVSPPADTQSLEASVGMTSMSESATTEEPTSPKSHEHKEEDVPFTNIVLAEESALDDADAPAVAAVEPVEQKGDATPTTVSHTIAPMSAI